MKKILLAAAILLVTVTAGAQPRFSVGIGATVHNYFMQTDILGGKKNFTSNSTGIFIDALGSFEIAEHFDIMTGLKGTLTGLGRKGVNLLQYKSITYGKNVSSEKMTFLELPVNLKYNIGSGRGSHFFVAAGPLASLWMSYNAKNTVEIGEQGATTKYDVMKEMKGYINRFNVGAGLSLGLESAAMRITLGYDYYFLDLVKKIPGTTARKGQARVGIAYMF